MEFVNCLNSNAAMVLQRIIIFYLKTLNFGGRVCPLRKRENIRHDYSFYSSVRTSSFLNTEGVYI